MARSSPRRAVHVYCPASCPITSSTSMCRPANENRSWQDTRVQYNLGSTSTSTTTLVFSYAENVALPAFAAALRAAAPCCCGTGCATIDRYLLLAWPTAANIPHAAAAGELDRRAIRRTERRMDTVPFHRPCSAHYADSANRRVLLSSYVITFSAVEGREAMGARVFDDSIQHGKVTVLVFVIRGYVARTHVSVRFVHATPASFIARHASLQQQHVNKGDRRRPTPPSLRCCALVSHFESTSYFCLLCLVDCGQT